MPKIKRVTTEEVPIMDQYLKIMIRYPQFVTSVVRFEPSGEMHVATRFFIKPLNMKQSYLDVTLTDNGNVLPTLAPEVQKKLLAELLKVCPVSFKEKQLRVTTKPLQSVDDAEKAHTKLIAILESYFGQ